MISIYHTLSKSILTLFVVGMLFSCENKLEEIHALEGGKDLPEQSITKGRYYYTQKGKLSNVLYAERLDQYLGEDERVEVNEGFEMVLFDLKADTDAVITADRGTFWVNDGIFKAEDNVVVDGRDGKLLYARELTWYRDSALIVSRDSVRIVTEDGIFRGAGMVADDTFTNYELRDVTGDIFVPSEKQNAKENK